MFGARVSLLILSLSSFYQDLETKDVKCDIGAPPMKDFSRRLRVQEEKTYNYYTTLTNSKIFTDSICFLEDDFAWNSYYAISRPNSFGEKKQQFVRRGHRSINYGENTLTMDYLPENHTKIFRVLSGTYTVLATDYVSYLILGACLEDFEKPFIRVLTDTEALIFYNKEKISKALKSLGLDESKFMPNNNTNCSI
ncbi:uncharacterized protein [Periplaneta americana]|uniref:uncharacterized protein n=1 Tax=Periplaneta americana TaxID=6978 RepID=UPI0037E745DC